MAHWAEIVGSMLREHWVWGGLILAVLLWYSTVTVYVAVKGIGDIRSMLKALGERKRPADNGRSTMNERQRKIGEDEP
jgi:hypothetical protein